jgi:hypothetical protein
MTILKKFDENGQEIGSEDVFITDSNLPDSIKQYGIDWTQGYTAAFSDIMKQITGMMTRTDEYGEWGVSDQVAGRRVKKFHRQKSLTLEKMNQILSESKLKP